MIEIPPDKIDGFRESLRAGQVGNLSTDIGYFLIWYAAVEFSITYMLALASRVQDLSVFDDLTSGMDMRVKIHRLRSIRKSRGGIGPNLDARLRILDDKCRLLRNRIAHSAFSVSESGPERYFASGLGSMPWKEVGGYDAAPPGCNPPVTITPSELLGWGTWLAALAEDFLTVTANGPSGPFEIANPKTKVPPAGQETHRRKGPHAKRHKPGQSPPL